MRTWVLLAAFAFFGCHDGLPVPIDDLANAPDLSAPLDQAQACVEGSACNVSSQPGTDGGCVPSFCAYACMMLPAGGNTGVCVLAGP